MRNSEDIIRFKHLYEQYAPGLIFYARKFVDHNTAEDIIHDVYLRIWNRDFFLIEESIRSYLFRAVRNSCLDYLKHLSVRNDYMSKAIVELKMEEITYYQDTDNQLIDQEQISSIYHAIDHLPEKCREIFKRSYLDDRKNAEIAQEFGISVRTVEAQIYKAMKTIREILKKNNLKFRNILLWINLM